MKDATLEGLREELGAIDRRMIELVAERQRLAAAIGRHKAERGIATRDYRQEKEVLERVRRAAVERGIDREVASRMFALLIRSSLAVQERDRVEAGATGSGREALVIGGGGRMGAWFSRFLASQGFAVTVCDPAGAPDGLVRIEDWRAPARVADLVVVATPIETCRRILDELVGLAPRGLVFDLASLKGPLRGELSALAAAGVRVTSIHPLFGPDTELLSNRHVVFVDLGAPGAVAGARELFASTMATLVDMELDQHDRLMAYVLGLSHALNLSFAAALAESGESVPKLSEVSSTTFDSQLAVASRVVSENPELYFEIQALNEFGGEALESLGRAVAALRRQVSQGRKDEFVSFMRAGSRYLSRLGVAGDG